MSTKMATQWSKSNQSMGIPNNFLLMNFSHTGLKHVANKLGNWGVATWQQLYRGNLQWPKGQSTKWDINST